MGKTKTKLKKNIVKKLRPGIEPRTGVYVHPAHQASKLTTLHCDSEDTSLVAVFQNTVYGVIAHPLVYLQPHGRVRPPPEGL